MHVGLVSLSCVGEKKTLILRLWKAKRKEPKKIANILLGTRNPPKRPKIIMGQKQTCSHIDQKCEELTSIIRRLTFHLQALHPTHGLCRNSSIPPAPCWPPPPPPPPNRCDIHSLLQNHHVTSTTPPTLPVKFTETPSVRENNPLRRLNTKKMPPSHPLIHHAPLPAFQLFEPPPHSQSGKSKGRFADGRHRKPLLCRSLLWPGANCRFWGAMGLYTTC